MIRTRIRMLLAVGLIVGLGNQLLYGEVITESFNVKPGGKLIVRSDIGSIKIMTSGKKRVEIRITVKSKFGIFGQRGVKPEDFQISIDQSGNDITILGDLPGRWRRGWDDHNLKVSYAITIPTDFNVQLTTAGGSISVEDLNGSAIAETSGGGIELGMTGGAVKAETSGGSISLSGSGQSAHLKTSGGSIKVGVVMGDLRASTSGGSIDIDEVGGHLAAHTSGGSIYAYLSNQPEDDSSLSTSGGSITVYLAEGTRVNLDASTSGGRVYVDMPITTRGSFRRNSVRGTINGGGPDLNLTTSGGSIKVLNR